MTPIDAQNLGFAATSAVGIVIFGLCYALLYALGRLRRQRALLYGAYGSYVLLLAATTIFADRMNLAGNWRWLLPVMLSGYLIGPIAIWRLCVASHVGSEEGSGEGGADG